MNFSHKKPGSQTGFIGAIGKPGKAPVALRSTAKHNFEVNRYEIRF